MSSAAQKPAGAAPDAVDDPGQDVEARVAQDRHERLVAQAHEGARLLERDPKDPVGRGLLGEAAAKLGDEAPDEVTALRDRFLRPVPPPLPIRTERLLLRTPRLDDVEAMHGWWGREDVAQYLLSPPLTRDQVEVEVRRRIAVASDGGPADRLHLVIELDGTVVGDLGLFLQGPSYSVAELAWTLHPDHAGRGIATEGARALLEVAFDHYGVHRVFADLDGRNDRSKALCERLGMRLETHALQDYWSKGEWTDSYRFGMLREEYARLRREL